jgi:hypothetical protein
MSRILRAAAAHAVRAAVAAPGRAGAGAAPGAGRRLVASSAAAHNRQGGDAFDDYTATYGE